MTQFAVVRTSQTLTAGASETHMFDPSGIAMPNVATFFSVWTDSIVNAGDIYTYFQPSGGSISPLGSPHPLGNVNPSSGLPLRFDWALPSAPGTAFANLAAHTGSPTVTLTYRGGYGYADSVAPCSGGVQLQGGAQFVYYLTPGLIDVWLTSVAMTWLAPFFTAFWFTALDATKLCNALPPIAPGTLTANPNTLSPGALWDLLRAIAWQNVCQCTSGVQPAVPAISQPSGVVPFPTTTCSNSNPCATLTDIWQDLANTQKTVNQIYQQLAQPILAQSTIHSGLSGIGSLAVSAIRAFSVTFTTVPSNYGTEFGNPATRWSVGRISWSDSNGVIDQKWVGETEWFLVPRTTTSLGYAFAPGVVATVTELV